MAQTLEGIKYPMAKVVNGGCRMEIKAPIPDKSPLDLKAQLVDVDDNGYRAVLSQRLTTAVSGEAPALIATVYGIVPYKRKPRSEGPQRPKPLVPRDVREIGWLRLGPRDGLAFACLTGDFNPIHWLSPYAKMAGFGRTILHGFGTLARSMEIMNQVLWSRDIHRLSSIEVRFTRPLRLPNQVGVYLKQNQLFVGDSPGGPAYLTGSFETKE